MGSSVSGYFSTPFIRVLTWPSSSAGARQVSMRSHKWAVTVAGILRPHRLRVVHAAQLTRLDLAQVAADGGGRPEPAEHAGECHHSERVARIKKGETEARAVGLRED